MLIEMLGMIQKERVRCRVEHEKIKFISTSGHVVFSLLCRHTNDDVFDDFPKISDHFSKIFQNCSEVKTNFSEHFRTFSEDFQDNQPGV